MATLSTRNAIVYIQGSSTTISEVLTEAGDVQISLDRELIDDTCFGDAGWQTNMMGLDSWSGSVTARNSAGSADKCSLDGDPRGERQRNSADRTHRQGYRVRKSIRAAKTQTTGNGI